MAFNTLAHDLEQSVHVSDVAMELVIDVRADRAVPSPPPVVDR